MGRRVAHDYLEAARSIAQEHGDYAQEIYLFPDPEQNEIRLIEIDPSTQASHDAVTPIRFETYPDIHFRLAVAVILPQEKGILPLPAEWGNWTQGQLIWPEENRVRRVG